MFGACTYLSDKAVPVITERRLLFLLVSARVDLIPKGVLMIIFMCFMIRGMWCQRLETDGYIILS